MARTGGPILVAMSGGVDSSVAAALLVRRGHEVIGVTMQIWQESQTDARHAGCCSLGAVEDARRVARVLGIPHYVVNFRDEFRGSVIDHFVQEYGRGRTPNPCVECNRSVKFEVLMAKMREFGCAKLATGHHARIRRGRDGRFRLMRARGREKDQSYVLYMLDQEQLSRTLFPVGEFDGKDQIRAIARNLGLSVADKPDSQDICFVSDEGGYAEFLRKRKPEMFAEGDIVDSEGRELGKHDGIAGYTVGQRRGLGISSAKPLYVLRLEPALNRVVVGKEDQLLTTEVRLDDVAWRQIESGGPATRVHAKIRYNMTPQPAKLIPGPIPRIVFDQAVRAATPGQIAVAYRGQTVVAGGIISTEQSGQQSISIR